jgi:2-polyprenyl-3-methyl-5-hydroxy-6-metoxy-1,4-benzoquinol methylase
MAAPANAKGVGAEPSARGRFHEEHRRIWNEAAGARGVRRAYHRRLEEIYRFLVSPHKRVLEVGCGEGDLLASLQPSHGVGVDFAERMLHIARARHPELHCVESSIEEAEVPGTFDFIVLSDVVNDLWDIREVLERCHRWCHPRTRLIVNLYSRLWQPVLGLARGTSLARKVPPQSWVTNEDMKNFLRLADFEVLRNWQEVLWPLGTPLVATACNKFLVKLPPFRAAALTNFFVARPLPRTPADRSRVSVSVVVPARNEAGNVRAILEGIPELGKGTEILFVEGGSTDGTFETIERERKAFSHRNVRLLRQSGRGKNDAVRLGFAEAEGDVLMIFDADVTVPPEDLAHFFDALVSEKGEFINGVRLVYPMENEAMRFFNFLGNKFFSLAFSTLLGQDIKDTLCGTKVLWREDYRRIEENRSYFGEFDPFGDFDLLFGAAKLNLRIVDMPVRYRERTYGTTNIQRWRHGWRLLKMVVFAARRIKFV